MGRIFWAYFFQEKRPPEKFTVEKFTSPNSSSKIQPRNRAKKITLHLCRATWLIFLKARTIRKAQSTRTTKFDPQTLSRKCSRECTRRCPRNCPRRLRLFLCKMAPGEPHEDSHESAHGKFSSAHENVHESELGQFSHVLFSHVLFLGQTRHINF